MQQGLQKALLEKEKISDSLTPEQSEEIDEKALTAIQLCLSDEILRKVLDEKTVVGLWLKLESLYMIKSLTNKLYLKQHLVILHMAEGTSIKSYLDEFSSIIMDLCSIDVKIEEDDETFLLLCSLPPSYKSFCEILFG